MSETEPDTLDELQELAMSVAKTAIVKQAERIAELEAKLARWRPVMKAALLADRDITDGLEPLRSSISQALDALSEPERSELLEEGK